jgi:NTP pyrophosphatase (non-canonical NTP hydrolase)
MEKNITLKEAQQLVDQWIKTYGVRYFSELTNMTVLTEEVGELARVMARKYGDQSFKEGEKVTLETRWQTCFGCSCALPTKLA